MKKRSVYYVITPFSNKILAKSLAKYLKKITQLSFFISKVDYLKYIEGEHEWV